MTVITTESGHESVARFPEFCALSQSYGSGGNRQLGKDRRKDGETGDTESWFYLRARSIADGKVDPMPNVSQLMPESA